MAIYSACWVFSFHSRSSTRYYIHPLWSHGSQFPPNLPAEKQLNSAPSRRLSKRFMKTWILVDERCLMEGLRSPLSLRKIVEKKVEEQLMTDCYPERGRIRMTKHARCSPIMDYLLLLITRPLIRSGFVLSWHSSISAVVVPWNINSHSSFASWSFF